MLSSPISSLFNASCPNAIFRFPVLYCWKLAPVEPTSAKSPIDMLYWDVACLYCNWFFPICISLSGFVPVPRQAKIPFLKIFCSVNVFATANCPYLPSANACVIPDVNKALFWYNEPVKLIFPDTSNL